MPDRSDFISLNHSRVYRGVCVIKHTMHIALWRDHIISFHRRRSRSAKRLDSLSSRRDAVLKMIRGQAEKLTRRNKENSDNEEMNEMFRFVSLANDGNQFLLQIVECVHKMSFSRLENK